MSREEWEAGTLTLPGGSAEQVRSAVLAAYNGVLTKAGQQLASTEGNRFESENSLIAFAGDKVYYSSGESNHQVEYARECPCVIALFTQLRKIAWQPGTGGSIMGSDEFNEEEDCEPYVVEHFGA